LEDSKGRASPSQKFRLTAERNFARERRVPSLTYLTISLFRMMIYSIEITKVIGCLVSEPCC
jgi:hypothetical protein